MGVVYEAEDTQLQRRVAVKLLPKDVSADADALARFLREARAAAQLNHPNVVAVYDIGDHGGTHYIVQELMTGGSAQDVLRDRGGFHWVEATAILRDVCRGLAAVHRTGTIHRDIKPANILRSADGVVKLGDFGLVRPTGATGTGVTGLGEVIGTPHYMSPEQCRCDPPDERSDLYALGATYFALLTGRPPFDSSDGMQVLFAHCGQPAPDPRAAVAGVPAECAALVSRAMEKERSRRFRDADAMLAALDAVLAGHTARGADSAEPPPVWALPEPAATAAPVSLAGAYPAERPEPAGRRPRRGRAVLTVAGFVLLAAFVLVLKVSQQPPAVAPEVDDWPKLSADADQAVTHRDADALRRALARLDLLQRRTADGPGRDAIPAGRVRLEKALAFRECITEKGFVIGMEGPVTGVAFSPDDRRLALGQALGGAGALVLDGHTGERHAAVWPTQGGKMTRVVAVAFDRDGKTLAAACTNNVVRLADVETGRESAIDLGSRVNSATSVAFSPTAAHLLIGMDPYGEGKGRPYQKLCDPGTGVELFAFKAEHSAKVAAVAFTAGGHQVATGSHDKRVVMWNAETGRIWRELRTGLTVRAVACSPNGRLLAVAGTADDGPVIQFWDYAAEKLLASRVSPHGACLCLAFSRDGARLASGSGPNVLVWDAEAHDLLDTLAGHGRDVLSVAFSARGGVLASGSADQTARLWDVARHLPPGSLR
jgi:hypothetical protein